jgi:Icc-related predicted phosphoesterase
MNSDWNILLDGDNHYGNTIYDDIALPRGGKTITLHDILNIKNKYKFDFIINTGDLCSHGYDNKCIFPLCCIKNGDVDEFSAFIDNYYRPLFNEGIKVYFTAGNHDTYVQWPYYKKPVFKFIKEVHGATYYMFSWKKSGCYSFCYNDVFFINMGVYPKNLSWLKKELEEVNKETPIVFIFHYVIADNVPYNDWWSNDEKEGFYNVIKDYNVILICNGHDHESRKDYWKDIPCIIGSGDRTFNLLKFNKTNFIDNEVISF